MPSFTCPSCKKTFHDLANIDGPCQACGAPWLTDQPCQPYVVGKVDIRLLAKRQRWIIWLLLGLLVSMMGGTLLGMTFSMAVMILIAMTNALIQLGALVLFILLMVAMRMHIAWIIICSFLMVVPLLNMFLLLLVNGRATRIMKRAGVHVGFMGVRDEEVVRLLSFNHCRQCGYDLTGNISGRCPECGREVPLALPIARAEPKAV